jgi:photosystem II stability/assembly factor-like uncharacterized protein
VTRLSAGQRSVRRAASRLACIAPFLLLLSLPSRGEDMVFLPAPQVSEPTQRMLLDITRAGDRLVAVGAAGLIIVSDDSGDSWRQAEVPVSATLTAVDFPTPEQGWAAGHAGVILHSADGGESWTLQYDGRDYLAALLEFAAQRRAELEAELARLEAGPDIDAALLEEAEFALEDAIFMQEDVQLALETGPADPFLDVRFLDAQRGMAAGAYGALLRTRDGGANWEIAIDSLSNPDRFHLYSILPSSEDDLFLAGEAGLLYRAPAYGEPFDRYDAVYDGSLFGLLETPRGVLAYGLRGNQFRYDYDSDSWELLSTLEDRSLYGGATFGDGSTLLLGAGGLLLNRSPAGDDEELLHPSRETLSAAARAPDGRVWLVGMPGLVGLAEARRQ